MKTEFGQKRKNNKKQTMAILMAGAYCFGRFVYKNPAIVAGLKRA